MKNLLLTAIAFTLTLYAKAEPVALSAQDVVDRVLANSIEKKKIDNDRVVKNEPLYEAMGVFDLGLETSLDYEIAEREPLGPFENEKDETLNGNFRLGKKLRTGTETSLAYTRQSVRSDLNSFLAGANQLSSRTIDFLTLEVMQPLLNNFWGGVDHRRELVQIALTQNYDHERLEALESLLVESLQFYWNTFSASKSLQASLASRDRYSNLVKVVERKQRLGFALPGELYQVKAEYEAQDRRVKESSRQYLISLDTLIRRLRSDEPLEIDFEIPEEIPAFPSLAPIAVSDLRQMKIAEQQVKAMRINQDAVSSSSIPELNLTGKLAYRGADENVNDAPSDLGSFNSPLYFVGIEFRTFLGSAAQDGAEQVARVKLSNAKLEQERVRRELRDQIKADELTAKNAFQNAKSSLQVVDFRKKAMKQIESAYKQGRRDLTEVINANTQLLLAETQLAQDIGDYHVALNTLSNTRDTLISDYTQPGDDQ
ncbi:MAG: TolC family protein [Bdellovibrionales bacterium]|nr:TolC family protein [Bdellovibrionales bacterium]